MRIWLVAATALAVLAAAAAAWPRDVTRAPAAACVTKRLPPAARAGELVLFGHVRTLVRRFTGFELRVDPAFWLGGLTANRAAREDKVIAPGDTVPNDYYIRDDGHRLLTFRVPTTARATVFTVRQGRVCLTRVGIGELAQLVRGKNPRRRALFDPRRHLGYWIHVRTDTVRSLDQQYQP